jgi:hypothetical protein
MLKRLNEGNIHYRRKTRPMGQDEVIVGNLFVRLKNDD